VLGVLIALGAEQVAQDVHDRSDMGTAAQCAPRRIYL
jgi:hypothetical protein